MNSTIGTLQPNQTPQLNQQSGLQQPPPSAGARRAGPMRAVSEIIQYLWCGSRASDEPPLGLFGRLTCITNAVSSCYTHAGSSGTNLQVWIEFEEGLQKWIALDPGTNRVAADLIRAAKGINSFLYSRFKFGRSTLNLAPARNRQAHGSD